MKIKYFFVLLCLIPVLFIVTKVLMINNIDKKVSFVSKELTYHHSGINMPGYARKIGINKYYSSARTKILFDTEDGLSYRRH